MSLPLTATEAPADTMEDFAAGARRLPFPRLAVFASISIPISAAHLPLAVYLPPLYAQEYGLSLGALVTLVPTLLLTHFPAPNCQARPMRRRRCRWVAWVKRMRLCVSSCSWQATSAAIRRVPKFTCDRGHTAR